MSYLIKESEDDELEYKLSLFHAGKIIKSCAVNYFKNIFFF